MARVALSLRSHELARGGGLLLQTLKWILTLTTPMETQNLRNFICCNICFDSDNQFCWHMIIFSAIKDSSEEVLSGSLAQDSTAVQVSDSQPKFNMNVSVEREDSSTLEEPRKALLENCSVCGTPLHQSRLPQLFPCLHSACSKCLSKQRKKEKKTSIGWYCVNIG